MIKRLIFDLDNTLIIWKDEYRCALQKAMEIHNVSIDYMLIDDVIESLEYKFETISKQILLDEINNVCNLNLDMSFINTLFEEQKVLAEYDEEVYDTLKYLSDKYELVILSNYFTEIQIGRLKKANILQFFKEVYGGDEIILKPRKEAFIKAIGNYKKEECIMIGDSLKIDIDGALNFGIKAIACDYFNKILNSDKYIKINKISELKNIL